jgi:hypothetical protein
MGKRSSYSRLGHKTTHEPTGHSRCAGLVAVYTTFTKECVILSMIGRARSTQENPCNIAIDGSPLLFPEICLHSLFQLLSGGFAIRLQITLSLK